MKNYCKSFWLLNFFQFFWKAVHANKPFMDLFGPSRQLPRPSLNLAEFLPVLLLLFLLQNWHSNSLEFCVLLLIFSPQLNVLIFIRELFIGAERMLFLFWQISVSFEEIGDSRRAVDLAHFYGLLRLTICSLIIFNIFNWNALGQVSWPSRYVEIQGKDHFWHILFLALIASNPLNVYLGVRLLPLAVGDQEAKSPRPAFSAL